VAKQKQQQKPKAAEKEEDGPLTRLGKVNHPLLGDCVRVRLRDWEGPTRPGGKGRYNFVEHLFPRDQGRWGSPPLACGYDDDGRRNCTIASSVSYSDELRRYGNFRWARPAQLS
jgi:hypothetical protein